jgi:hypothetical protein
VGESTNNLPCGVSPNLQGSNNSTLTGQRAQRCAGLLTFLENLYLVLRKLTIHFHDQVE